MLIVLAISDAESFGFLIGTIFGILFLIFTPFAVWRAITKKTTVWIIAAAIGVSYFVYIIYATLTGEPQPREYVPPPSAAHQPEQSNPWRVFHSPEGDFSVEVPGQLTDKSQIVEGSAGKVNRFRYTMVADMISYSAERSDFAPGLLASQPLDQFFEGFKKSRLASMMGRLLEESSIELGPARGIELKFEVQKGDVFVVSKSYVLGDSLYSVVVVTSPSLISSPSVQRFFSSFRLNANSQ